MRGERPCPRSRRLAATDRPAYDPPAMNTLTVGASDTFRTEPILALLADEMLAGCVEENVWACMKLEKGSGIVEATMLVCRDRGVWGWKKLGPRVETDVKCRGHMNTASC